MFQHLLHFLNLIGIEIEKKINDHDHSNKYITTQEFNNLTPEIFAD